MTRDEVMVPIVKTIRQGTALSAPDILDYFKDWTATPVLIDGRHVATHVTKGTEIHFALVPGWRPTSCQRGVIREIFRPLIERYGYATTRVPHFRPAQKRFVQRLGFKPTWQDEQVSYYLLGDLPFKRNP
jgi:hypothetical protein